MDERGARFTANRVKSEISRVFRFAILSKHAERDPCEVLKGAVPLPKAEKFASITGPQKIGELLRVFDALTGTFIVKSALLLSPLLFVRPGKLHKAAR